jgi:large subunit ribosomal protein L35
MAKNKVKTRKSVVKRFHETSTGKLMHRSPGRAHSMVKKSPGNKRRLKAETPMDPSKNKAVGRALPYGSNY